MKISSILGINARTQLFSYKYNKKRGKYTASSKLRSKKVLAKSNIPIPTVLAKFKNPETIEKFDWNSLPPSFAVKPNRGLGGEGIIVIKKKAADANGWITTKKTRVTVQDLKLHILDILEGAYSLHNTPDMAFIEEYVGRHKAFRKYAFRGTPDIRVIVFNKVPVMAMLRLPTLDSGGRANLHQGAIGVGIDIATGITTKAIQYSSYISYKPDTKRKLHGIKIPKWTRILELAVESQIVSGLGLVGVDIVLHPEKGPMILELNYQPGMSIQLANATGLRKRLERIEDLEVVDVEHGVKLAKALFAGSFARKIRSEEEGIKKVFVFEDIKIKNRITGKKIRVQAKLDTGAWRTSIDKKFANELGLLEPSNILWEKKVRNTLGRQTRPVIDLTFWLKGRKIETSASVTKRDKLRKKVLIGRKDLQDFLVIPKKDAK